MILSIIKGTGGQMFHRVCDSPVPGNPRTQSGKNLCKNRADEQQLWQNNCLPVLMTITRAILWLILLRLSFPSKVKNSFLFFSFDKNRFKYPLPTVH